MQAKAKLSKQNKRRRLAAPIGGLFVLLAVIGVVTVVVSSIRLTFNFLDNNREKQMFEDIVRPVVMFNPLPFEDPAAIDMPELLRYSMWAALTGENRESYQIDDATQLIVPANDLDIACTKLFGAEIELVHQSFGDIDARYYYEEDDNVYNVPVTSQLLVYSPKVYDITKDGEFYNLLVGYIPPENAWTANYVGGSSEQTPQKYMIYVMRRSGSTYQIAKVRDDPRSAQQYQDAQ